MVFAKATLVSLLGLASYVSASCECGYIQDGSTVWTDALVTDFTAVTDASKMNDWVAQTWTSAQDRTTAPYGRARELRNVVPNPASTSKKATADDGSTAGLNLFVRSQLEAGNTLVPVSEINSARKDIMYGSFRAVISSGASTNPSSAYAITTSELSHTNGDDASTTSGFKKLSVPFVASAGMHEYRFDWTPTKLAYYIDSVWQFDISTSGYVPNGPGFLLVNHWSNGNQYWSQGPPTSDAKLTLGYINAYFNSSSSAASGSAASSGKSCSGKSSQYCTISGTTGAAPVSSASSSIAASTSSSSTTVATSATATTTSAAVATTTGKGAATTTTTLATTTVAATTTTVAATTTSSTTGKKGATTTTSSSNSNQTGNN
ncbi:hypothetical protein BJ546DRAFT_1059727 [Cryomyces antarcticus]|uniref:GH16 domain-containing protein n=1 Tax=Cryomyces antarcticus TaxID=329879 RepID=A0ABR0KWX7_9PEZI|nr:hypothetical protein LTR39_000015 [Cryomyces antarcticus]KAK5021391.1 hypothetical protein LTR60_000007 [Cryomyces antarcticus]KAK5132131.1 hypothetical protein LTR16_000011 [Cryomyces antarcticus]